eukprot:SAG11_NODE_5170_length_1641_cov_1.225681_3_plen_162_part_00
MASTKSADQSIDRAMLVPLRLQILCTLPSLAEFATRRSGAAASLAEYTMRGAWSLRHLTHCALRHTSRRVRHWHWHALSTSSAASCRPRVAMARLQFAAEVKAFNAIVKLCWAPSDNENGLQINTRPEQFNRSRSTDSIASTMASATQVRPTRSTAVPAGF